MKIGILSDTHGILREEVMNQLKGCEVIIHGGDIGKEEMVDTLEQVAKVYVVRGNNDKESWCNSLPERIAINLGELRILVIHDAKGLKGEDLSKVDVVVCGHSHKYRDEVVGHVRYLNPGSCGRKRFGLPLTMMRVELGHHKIEQVEKIDLSNE